VFFDRLGRPRSASAVYAELSNRYERARAVAFAPELRGTVTPDPAHTASTRRPAVPPDTAGMAQAFADAHDARPQPAARPFFETMFSDRGGGAVANTVSRLWTGQKGAAPRPAQAPLPGGAINPLDLFVDSARNARRLFGGKV